VATRSPSRSRDAARARAWIAAIILASLVVVDTAAARVLLIVVDGLDAHEVDDDATPRLARAARQSAWCPGTHSSAAMPTRTNTNHATLLTGVQPAAHGITGNTGWDREGRGLRKLGAPGDFLVETIFTLAHRAGRGLRTGIAVGKPKLGAMFAAYGNRQAAPDEVWDPRRASDSAKDDVTGYAYDGTTLAAARNMVEHGGIDFLFVNLADVDRVSHGHGPASPQAVETRRRTDAALGAFLDWLATRPDWSATTVVITADHGFDPITKPPVRMADALADHHIRGLSAVGDGGVAHLYLERTRTADGDAALLAAARRVALAQPGIAEALYLAANARDGGTQHTLAQVHPDWHLQHERSGDLLLVAKPGYQIVDGSSNEAKLVGNHGGPGERAVPAIVLGGAPIGSGDECETVTAADLGRTVQACLGLGETERLDGRGIAGGDRGRVLAGICGAPSPPVTPP
jgi:hypothetical protein